MSTLRNIACAAAFGVCTSLSFAALADGLAATPAQLSVEARTSLNQSIERWREQHPEAFEALANVKSHKPEVYKNLRNPTPIAVTRELRGLGAAALLPMLEALAFHAPARQGATDLEWDALGAGMLEAVGVLRDPRSGPVLAAVFEGAGARPLVAGAAARALGRLGGNAELEALAAHTAKDDPLRMHAIQGLGELRRIESARQLAALLAGADDDTAKAIAEALGILGSSWAWRALGPKAATAGAEVRAACAKALVPTFVRRASAARAAAHDALLMVALPSSVDLLQSERASAPAETARAIDSLVQRLAKAR